MVSMAEVIWKCVKLNADVSMFLCIFYAHVHVYTYNGVFTLKQIFKKFK